MFIRMFNQTFETFVALGKTHTTDAVNSNNFSKNNIIFSETNKLSLNTLKNHF